MPVVHRHAGTGNKPAQQQTPSASPDTLGLQVIGVLLQPVIGRDRINWTLFPTCRHWPVTTDNDEQIRLLAQHSADMPSYEIGSFG